MQRNNLEHLEPRKFPRFRGIEGVIAMEREEQSDNSWHTIAIVLLCCGVIKMLHLLGVISGEGESHCSIYYQIRTTNQQGYTPQEDFAYIKLNCFNK